jgi:hypothetical protein
LKEGHEETQSSPLMKAGQVATQFIPSLNGFSDGHIVSVGVVVLFLFKYFIK